MHIPTSEGDQAGIELKMAAGSFLRLELLLTAVTVTGAQAHLDRSAAYLSNPRNLKKLACLRLPTARPDHAA